MQNQALKTLFIYNGIFVFAASLLGPLYALFVETVDDTAIAVSFSWFAFLFSTTFFMLIVRRFGDSFKEKEMMLITGYLLRSVLWFLFPFASSLNFIIVLQVLLGVGEALGTPAYDAIFAEHLDKGKAIKQYTDWKLIANIVGAIAVLIGGIIVNEYGFNVLFFLMSGLSFISFLGILLKPRDLL